VDRAGGLSVAETANTSVILSCNQKIRRQGREPDTFIFVHGNRAPGSSGKTTFHKLFYRTDVTAERSAKRERVAQWAAMKL
jgi:hypothetical protein